MATLPGTWQEPHRDVLLSQTRARELWVGGAVQVLEKVAEEYGGCITYTEFADQLSKKSQVYTKQLLRKWVGVVLADVITACNDRGLPELSSLVVHTSDGMVGTGFNTVLERSGRERIDDPLTLEWAAADERLKCYLVYCTNLPADPKPQLTREYAAQVKRREASEPKVKPVCANVTCGMQLPNTGICDYCG